MLYQKLTDVNKCVRYYFFILKFIFTIDLRIDTFSLSSRVTGRAKCNKFETEVMVAWYTLRGETFANQAIREITSFREDKLSQMDYVSVFREDKLSQMRKIIGSSVP